QDRTGVHDDLNRRQKLRPQEHEDTRHVEEEGQHPKHAVNRILASDGQKRADNAGKRQVVEGRGEHGSPWLKRSCNEICHEKEPSASLIRLVQVAPAARRYSFSWNLPFPG